jgi:ketosteroid isomerase-like protein
MKEWSIRAILFAALIALGIWGWGVFFPSPEKVIRKRLGELAKSASFSSKGGLVAQAWNASMLADFFTEDVEVAVDLPGDQPSVNGRAELLQAAALVRSRIGGLSVEFPDIKVTVAPDGASAIVNLTARAKVPGERDSYLQELRMRLTKIKRDWFINQVQSVKTLSLNSYLRGLPWERPEPA